MTKTLQFQMPYVHACILQQSNADKLCRTCQCSIAPHSVFHSVQLLYKLLKQHGSCQALQNKMRGAVTNLLLPVSRLLVGEGIARIPASLD